MSEGASCSNGVTSSKGVTKANGVDLSYGIVQSNGVAEANGVIWSHGVFLSSRLHASYGVFKSYGLTYSLGIARSSGVSNSSGVGESIGVENSKGVYNCFAVLKCNGIANSIFCVGISGSYYLFNQQVTKERIVKVKNTILDLLDDWRPAFNNLKELYREAGFLWSRTPIPKAESLGREEVWLGMPKKVIKYLKSLPEFDAEIFEKITGMRI